MGKRHNDAWFIQEGAVNPSAIAHSIAEACAEAREEGGTVHRDAAVRLMVHQLAFICGIITGFEEFTAQPKYSECLQECLLGRRDYLNSLPPTKSDILREFAEANGIQVIELKLVEPQDLRGLPFSE